MKIIELKEKHPAIYKRAMEYANNRRKQKGIKSKASHNNALLASFTFNDTKEGYAIWRNVDDGKFAPFYEFHGLKESKDKSINWPMIILGTAVLSLILFGIYSAFKNFKLWTI